jgi:hypothetical protein
LVNWPKDLAAILDGPRGRRVCWELTWVTGSMGPGWGVYTHGDVAPAQLAAELASGATAAATGGLLSAAAIFDALERSVSVAMYWQEPDDVDRALADPDVSRAMVPVATVLAASPATAWWAAGMDAADQHIVVFDDDTPVPVSTATRPDLTQWQADTLADEQQAAVERPSDPSANWSGAWWSAPVVAGLYGTTRALPGAGPAGLCLVEDQMGWKTATSQRISVPLSARIFEITGPRAWAQLVADYPFEVSHSRRHDWWRATGRAGTWLIPDYLAVAEHFDAIHLPVAGYLTTAGRPVDVGSDAASVLAGWDPDQTYWLTDPPASAGPSQRWVATESRWIATD